MKIIKEGDDSVVFYPVRFTCETCGCVFEADNREYNTWVEGPHGVGGTVYVVDCPTCGRSCVTRK